MVIASFAQSADGRIATRTGASRSISGAETTHLAHRLRDYADAILVGIGTVLQDDPELTCRIPGGTSPIRVIIDTHLRLPPECTIARTAHQVPTIIFAARGEPTAHPERSAALAAAGITIHELPTPPRAGDNGAPRSGIDVAALLHALSEQNINTLFVEGGSRVLAGFLAAKAIHTMIVVMAPFLIGSGTPSFAPGVLPDEVTLETTDMFQIGRDLVWEVTPRYGG
jgi:riboflavin-specific deaminase-like protein